MYLRKTYLSRAMTRAFSMDAPIGDPFGGPAYGERNDPVSATVTFFEAATAFETVAAVGAALSVVGMVTGNSDMTKIGGVMGLVGGFGTLAQMGTFGTGPGSMQEWAQSTNSAFTSNASNISSAAAPTVAETAGAGSATIDGAASAGIVEGGTDLNLAQVAGPVESQAVNTVAEGGNGLIDAGVAPQISIDTPITGPQTTATVSGLDASGNMLPGTGTAPTAAATPLDIAKLGEPANAMAATASQGGNLAQIKAASTGINTGTSLWDKVSAFAEKNPTATALALKGVAGMYVSPQEAALKEAQARASSSAANLYDARAATETAQLANANAVPSVTGMQVNPNAQVYNAKPVVTAAGVRPAGLIQTRSM